MEEAVLSKRYGPWFIWGQLSGWFKQTVYDPTASLSAERRGTISLPDIESAYGNSRYTPKVSLPARHGVRVRRFPLHPQRKLPSSHSAWHAVPPQVGVPQAAPLSCTAPSHASLPSSPAESPRA